MGAPRSAPDGRNGSSIWDSRHVMDGFSRVNSFKLRTTLRRNLLTNEHFCVDIMHSKTCKRCLWLTVYKHNAWSSEIRSSPITEKKGRMLSLHTIRTNTSQEPGLMCPVKADLFRITMYQMTMWKQGSLVMILQRINFMELYRDFQLIIKLSSTLLYC